MICRSLAYFANIVIAVGTGSAPSEGPDKGSCMAYDLNRAASAYLDNDIEMLKRLQASVKIVIG